MATRQSSKRPISYTLEKKTYLADYYTKHFPSSHHQEVRSKYALNNIQAERYCKGVLKPSKIVIPNKMVFTRNKTVPCTGTLTRPCKRNKVTGNAVKETDLQPFKSNFKTQSIISRCS